VGPSDAAPWRCFWREQGAGSVDYGVRRFLGGERNDFKCDAAEGQRGDVIAAE